MIITHIDFVIQPAKEAEFVEAMQPLMAASREEQGNHRYELVKRLEQEHAYTMVEVWENKEAVEAHNVSEHFKAFVAQAPQFLAAPLAVQSFVGEKVS